MFDNVVDGLGAWELECEVEERDWRRGRDLSRSASVSDDDV